MGRLLYGVMWLNIIFMGGLMAFLTIYAHVRPHSGVTHIDVQGMRKKAIEP